jgi:hypothetical protein
MGTFVATSSSDVFVAPGPEPVGAAMAEALASLYGLNAWGVTGTTPGWPGENTVGWDLGDAADKLQHFPEHNIPTTPGSTRATGADGAVPGLNPIRVKMAQAGI